MMKTFRIVLFAFVSVSPMSSFAQLDGTGVGTGNALISQQQHAFIVSCKGNENERKLLHSALAAINRDEPQNASLVLNEFKSSAAPGGNWKSDRLKRCYQRVLSQIDGAAARRMKRSETSKEK